MHYLTTPQKITIPGAKRFLDIVVSILLLIFLSPLFLLLSLFILAEQLLIRSSRGPLLYCETRVSGGQAFRFCKIRIFKQSVLDRERLIHAVVHTKPLEHDPENMTYYGRFLKQIYCDELPQLFHVLKGQMTLVGPRPTNIENSEKLKGAGDYTKERMLCGITGPFQAAKGSDANQYEVDSAYIDFVATHSGWEVIKRDVGILCSTIRTVVEAKGI
jgi:lipopolysaccharide/colanic/teichoic acid biosynthesis glycosyltransferase